ncbi:hypothetical protein JCM14469_37560 [Desulfatiferula olefinivorans]
MSVPPVYIVSGYMRSGTSMMMKALSQSGMTVRYNPDKDRILTDKYQRPDYHPNPDGFYELGPREFEAPDFPAVYRGQVIKALHWRLPLLPPFDYRVVFMLRHPEEIEVSYLKMFRRRPPFVLKTYDAFIEKTFARLEARGDMTVTPVWHHAMIEDPLAVLERLKDEGFPLNDPRAGARAVKPLLYRSRPGDLEGVRQSIPGLNTDVPDFLKKTPGA